MTDATAPPRANDTGHPRHQVDAARILRAHADPSDAVDCNEGSLCAERRVAQFLGDEALVSRIGSTDAKRDVARELAAQLMEAMRGIGRRLSELPIAGDANAGREQAVDMRVDPASDPPGVDLAETQPVIDAAWGLRSLTRPAPPGRSLSPLRSRPYR